MIREESIQIPFQYAAGKAASRFFTALRDDAKILAAPCPGCGRVYCPARSFCTQCGAELSEYLPVGPGGALISWTEVPGRGVFGLIKLDGADTAILHRVLGPPEKLVMGARVQARSAAERTGGILDLEGFEIVEGGCS